MRTVRLYGYLGERYGRVHHFDVRTPAEAVRALCANFKGMRQTLAQGAWRVLVGGKSQTEAQLHNPLDANISIVPVVAGSGGLGRIVLGAALIGASFFLPATPIISGFSFSASSIAANLGFSMVLGGISQMLFKPPSSKVSTTERPNNKPSYTFDGAVNTIGQGNPVPLLYGRGRVGSQVISAGLAVEALAA